MRCPAGRHGWTTVFLLVTAALLRGTAGFHVGRWLDEHCDTEVGMLPLSLRDGSALAAWDTCPPHTDVCYARPCVAADDPLYAQTRLWCFVQEGAPGLTLERVQLVQRLLSERSSVGRSPDTLSESAARIAFSSVQSTLENVLDTSEWWEVVRLEDLLSHVPYGNGTLVDAVLARVAAHPMIAQDAILVLFEEENPDHVLRLATPGTVETPLQDYVLRTLREQWVGRHHRVARAVETLGQPQLRRVQSLSAGLSQSNGWSGGELGSGVDVPISVVAVAAVVVAAVLLLLVTQHRFLQKMRPLLEARAPPKNPTWQIPHRVETTQSLTTPSSFRRFLRPRGSGEKTVGA